MCAAPNAGCAAVLPTLLLAGCFCIVFSFGLLPCLVSLQFFLVGTTSLSPRALLFFSLSLSFFFSFSYFMSSSCKLSGLCWLAYAPLDHIHCILLRSSQRRCVCAIGKTSHDVGQFSAKNTAGYAIAFYAR